MIDIEIEDEAWVAAAPQAQHLVEAAAAAALRHAEFDVDAVTILLTDDESVRDLNARFRDKDRPTNVLSFPAAESAFPHLGDVVLGYAYCAAEAQAQGKSLSDHLSHLVVHGVLHLLGRDHEDDAEAEEMEAEEREILAQIGVADPYLAEQD